MPETKEPLIVDVVSDVVCPWCFIGKKRIENALALIPDIPVELRFRPYFLNDWIPREGISAALSATKALRSVSPPRPPRKALSMRWTRSAASPTRSTRIA